MRRAAVLVAILLATAAALGPRLSHADVSGPITQFNGLCFVGPYTTMVPCTTPGPATPRPLIVPNKGLAVAGPISQTAGTSTYTVDLVSQLVCFTQSEPIEVYTF